MLRSWLYKMLTAGKAGWRTYVNSLSYFCSFSLNLKLFQDKKLKNKYCNGSAEESALKCSMGEEPMWNDFMPEVVY